MKYVRHLSFWVLQLLVLSVFGQQEYKVGDLFTAPDGSMGVVYYLFPDRSGGWVVALNDAAGTFKWQDSAGVNIPFSSFAVMNPDAILNYQQDTAGYQNTQFLRDYGAGIADAVDFDHGWYVPAAKQLTVLFSQFPFVEPVLQQYGTILESTFYWSSDIHTNGAAYALSVGTPPGFMSSRLQSALHPVRAVRTFRREGVDYDTTLTYLWNTGSTQPFITPSPPSTTTYTVTATTDMGCSNTAAQTIFVAQNSPQEFYDEVCQGEPYEANGFSVTAEETAVPGLLTYTRTVIADGCSSVVTLYLTVMAVPFTEMSVDACQTYVWNGMTYYENGDYEQHFVSASGCDSTVVLHLTLHQPDTTYLTVSECGSYTMNGVTYNFSGEYVRHLYNASGCDSVVILDLTILPSQHITVDTVLYDGLTWGDSLWTNSGTYQLTYTNQYGCDSVITIHLTVIQRDSVYVDSTVCGSELPLTWNGVIFTEAGTQIVTLHPVEHHDSVVVMTLHVNPVQHLHFDSTVCDVFVWNGENYPVSGDYTFSFTDQNGCDSIVTYHLTVHTMHQVQFTDMACDSYTWNDQTYTQSGVYTQTFHNQQGCDSTVTLTLTIHPSHTTSFDTTVCNSFVWNGTTYTQTGDYVQQLTNVFGCDSLVTAHLTVHRSDTVRVDTVVCPYDLPIVVRGFTFAGEGTQTGSFTNVHGCDSVVTVHVVLSDISTQELNVTACEFYNWRGVTYTESGVYEKQLTNVNGCWYTSRLHLTIHHGDTTFLDTTCCSNQLPVYWNGRARRAEPCRTATTATVWW